jgi:hypothetical protein
MRLALAIGLLVACHKPVDMNGGVDAPPKIDGSIDGAVPPGWTTLISRSWSLVSNSEGYKCTIVQVPQDMWITGYQSLAPAGTHHSVLTKANSHTVGDYDCSAGSELLNNEMMYAAGVATDENLLPTGVAIHLVAGTYINLNLHLFNATDFDMTDHVSGVLVKTVAQSEVVHEADMMFAGTYNIGGAGGIPPDNTPHTATGGCNAAGDMHVFTLWPHMHQIATHQKLVITHSGVPTTMLDVDYSFTNQKNYPMADTLVHSGDQIQTTCTYINNTGVTDPPAHNVGFGDSSTAEMCFTGVYKYPAGGTLFQCTSG